MWTQYPKAHKQLQPYGGRGYYAPGEQQFGALYGVWVLALPYLVRTPVIHLCHADGIFWISSTDFVHIFRQIHMGVVDQSPSDASICASVSLVMMQVANWAAGESSLLIVLAVLGLGLSLLCSLWLGWLV